MIPRSPEHIRQWHNINKAVSGNRKLNQGLCKDCSADFQTCSNDCELDGESKVSYCSYFNLIK